MRQALNQVTVGVEDVHKPRAGASHRIVPGGVLLSISDVEIRTDPLDVEWGKATRNPGIPLIPLIPVVLEGICTQVHLLEVGVEYVNVPATQVSGQNELLSADFGNGRAFVHGAVGRVRRLGVIDLNYGFGDTPGFHP